MTDLLPCPWGDKPSIHRDGLVYCLHVQAITVEAWNTRAPSPKIELPQEVQMALHQPSMDGSTGPMMRRVAVLSAFIRRIAGEEKKI